MHMRKNGRSPRTFVFEVTIRYNPKERTPYKYTVNVPALPGCFSEGRSRDEAVRNIKEAIALMMAAHEDRRRKDAELVEVAL